MSHSVQMPALGESVTEGTVTRWLKSEGEQVEVDEPLLEVSTDKVDTEIPSPVRRACSRRSWSARTRPPRSAPISRSSATDPGHRHGDGGAVRRQRRPAAGRRRRTGAGTRTGGGARRAAAAPAEAPSTDTDAPAEKPTAGTGGAAGSGTSVTLPEMGESVTEGTVTRWLKAVGDEVAARRTAGRGVHRQGRHRDPLPRRRHPAGDHRRRGRDHRGRRPARRDR